MIALQDLKRKISNKLENNTLPAKVLQSQFKIGFDKPVALFGDPTYMPFYYHLGKTIRNAKNLIEFGFDLGMPSGCFMKGCTEIECFVAFRKNSNAFHSKRLGVANIHNIFKKKFDLWIGNEADPEFVKMVLLHKWDCAIIGDREQTEQTYRAYLDLVWSQMRDGGLVIVDYLQNPDIQKVYNSFCKLQNREPFTINTIRGTGILQR